MKNQSGKAGEDHVARWLESQGYEILARNFHSRYGEIDIVAQRPPYIAFVEVKARGGDVLALTTRDHGEEMRKTANGVITIPEIHPLLLPSLGVVPLQLFAYYVALMRGCDIDKPRNLAKSVTVE